MRSFSRWAFCLAFALGISASAQDEVVVVKLRAPRDAQDARFDPYYDLGLRASFGITRCHRSNILHPARFRENLLGRRVAFVQQGFDPATAVSQQRVVFLTPVLEASHLELVGNDPDDRVALIRWDGTRLKPLKFAFAPVLVANDGTGIAELVRLARATRRATLVAGFGSLFRTRIGSLRGRVATEIIEAWEAASASAEGFAESYAETMNPPPRTVDADRAASFRSFRDRAVGRTAACMVRMEDSPPREAQRVRDRHSN